MKSHGKSIEVRRAWVWVWLHPRQLPLSCRPHRSQSSNEESRHSTKETDNLRSTYIDKVRRSQIVNGKFTYLLSAANVQDGRQYQTITLNDRQLNAKTIYPKSKDCKLIAKRKWRGTGCRTYLESQSNFALVDAVAQRRRSTGTFGDDSRWRRRAKTNYRHRRSPTTIGPIRFGPYTILLPLYFTIWNCYRKLLSHDRQLFPLHDVDRSSPHRSNE